MRSVEQVRSRPSTYIAMGAGILLLDLFTGKYLLFPILFVIPVVLSAWYCGARLAYALAILLPVGRFFIAALYDLPSPLVFIAANALVRIAVLVLIVYLVRKLVGQTRALEKRVDELAKICAWSRTIEYQGQWISFEEYLLRRFNIESTHGMSPAEAQKQIDELMRQEAGDGKDR